MNKVLSFFSLFGSLSTLLCCALPVTLVTLGMGASFASLTSSFPQIIWLTERKEALFIIAGVLLIISFFLMKRAENIACPIDPDQAAACESGKNISKPLYWTTVIIYLIGLSFSYLIPAIVY